MAAVQGWEQQPPHYTAASDRPRCVGVCVDGARAAPLLVARQGFGRLEGPTAASQVRRSGVQLPLACICRPDAVMIKQRRARAEPSRRGEKNHRGWRSGDGAGSVFRLCSPPPSPLGGCGAWGQRARALGFCRVVKRCRASVPFPVISTLDDFPSAEPAQGKRVGGGCGTVISAVWQTDTIARSTRRGCVRLLQRPEGPRAPNNAR